MKNNTNSIFTSSDIKDNYLWHRGLVIHGKGVGKKLGFPTLNLKTQSDFSLDFGVYACLVSIQQKVYAGALHYGPRLVFAEKKPCLEIHLIDFDGDLYGKSVSFAIVKRLRRTVRFKNKEELVVAIRKDCQDVVALIDGMV